MFTVIYLIWGDISATTYKLMGVPQLPIEGIFGDDDGAAVDANSSARSYPDEDGILALGVVHQLDHLMHQDADRGRSHAMADAQHRSHFVHGVAIRIGADVLQLGARWQLVANLVHYEMGKILHALWCAAHANELKVKDRHGLIEWAFRRGITGIVFQICKLLIPLVLQSMTI